MRSQVTIIRRVTITDVNIEVQMPMARVTPKPLTGPEPRANSRIATMKVVALESLIVVQAR